nr:DUF4013 domain-containing protein [uncultured Methanoregula sp.]
MDFGKLVGDSFGYAKEGLVGKWVTWILLIISCIIFPLIMGYIMRVYRGAASAPELNEWVSMFIDGIKLFVVGLIYAIPIIIIEFVVLGSAFVTAISANAYGVTDPGAVMGLIGALLFGIIILAIVSIIIGLIVATAVVRFARTNSFGEAFNFGAIFAHIGKIGFVSYLVALIIMGIIMGVIEVICMMIPYIGMVLLFILLPVLVLFEARYLTLLYDSAGTAA